MEFQTKVVCICALLALLVVLPACSPEQIQPLPVEETEKATVTPIAVETKIEIDGVGDDWVDRPLLYEDKAEDAETGFLDITRVYTFVNQDALYLLMEVVNPDAEFSQIDVELSADFDRVLVNWRPGETEWKQFPRSQFVLGTVLEGRIDLADIGLPEETVVISQIRVMYGTNLSQEEWREVDGFIPLLKPVVWVNEYDSGARDEPEELLDSSGRRINYTTSGYIDKDEIWQDEIHITGDIEFVNDAVLTIEPGTIVYIAANSDDRQANDTVGCYDEYSCLHQDPTTIAGWGANTVSIDARHGVLIAEGTSEAPIVIRPEGDSTSTSQFGTILIERGSLKHVNILYSNGVEILGFPDGFEIAYSEIRHCISTCLTISKSNVWVHHSTIEGGGYAALRAGNNSLIEHNVFLGSNVGILVQDREDVILRNNLILDCSTGIAVNGRGIEVTNNTIAYVAGPPDGIYYQEEMIYPLFDSWIDEFGIGADGHSAVVNNIIAAPYPVGLFSAEYDPLLVVKYNLVWDADSWAGGAAESLYSGSNFVAAPLFVDLENGDLNLAPGSPAIDAGFPDVLDPDGTPSDLGAYGGPYGADW